MMIFLEMAHHAQIGQASIFKQTQVILIESDLNATTDCSFDFHILYICTFVYAFLFFQQDVQNKEIKRAISFSILV